jgi:hypothetical protein
VRAICFSVPLLYTLLVLIARSSRVSSEHSLHIVQDADKWSVKLKDSLHFLCGAFHPLALWWPVVEAGRTLTLTGFLALGPGTPGSVTQLFCGVIAAVSFLIVQLWCAPYVSASNNLVAMVAGTSLVLNLIASLGLQVNAKLSDGDQDADIALITAMLCISAFLVLTVTICVFCATARHRAIVSRPDSTALQRRTRESSSAFFTNCDPCANIACCEGDGQQRIRTETVAELDSFPDQPVAAGAVTSDTRSCIPINNTRV